TRRTSWSCRWRRSWRCTCRCNDGLNSIDRYALFVIVSGSSDCLHRRAELIAVPLKITVAGVKQAIGPDDVAGLVLEGQNGGCVAVRWKAAHTTSPIRTEGRDRLRKRKHHQVIRPILIHKRDAIAGYGPNGAQNEIITRNHGHAVDRSDPTENRSPVRKRTESKFFPRF